MFFDDIDLFECTLTIYVADVFVSLIHQNFSHVINMPPLTIFNNLLRNLWIFWKNVILQESFPESGTLHSLHGYVNEFRLFVCAYIVIANIGVGSRLYSELKLHCRQALRHQIVPYANNTLFDEIHVGNFLLLVQNQLVIFCIIEFLGPETKAYVIEELGILVLSRMKEVPILENNIVKQIMKHNMPFDLARALI